MAEHRNGGRAINVLGIGFLIVVILLAVSAFFVVRAVTDRLSGVERIERVSACVASAEADFLTSFIAAVQVPIGPARDAAIVESNRLGAVYRAAPKTCVARFGI